MMMGRSHEILVFVPAMDLSHAFRSASQEDRKRSMGWEALGRFHGRSSIASSTGVTHARFWTSSPTARDRVIRGHGARDRVCLRVKQLRQLAEVVELSRSGVVTLIDPADGGRIISLVIAGVERILPKERARAREPALYWGCYPMVPWPGRLAHGRIPTNDGEVRLQPNLPPSAIHALGFDKSWVIVERSETAVTMAGELRGLGWPFGGRALQRLRLGVRGLELELEVGGYTKAGSAGPGRHTGFTPPAPGDLPLSGGGS